MSKKLIVVVGANGRQAQAAIGKLLDEGFNIRALVRNFAKASDLLKHEHVEIVEGDLSKPDTLEHLFDNAYGLFMVLPYTHQALDYGHSLLELARQSQLQHIVYSSVGGAERYEKVVHFRDKKAIEEHLQSTGIPYTILRPAGYMDEFAHPKSIRFIVGLMRLYMSNQSRFQLIALQDIGRFVAIAFNDPEQFKNRALEIAGDELTLDLMLEKIARVNNKTIKPFKLPRFIKWLLPSIMTQMCEFYAADGWQADLPALRELNPQLLSFEDWLKATDVYGH
ncbi:MAG: NmrA family NAD(P)-binding protein [Gammaproteobacteria bacterium]|nr:NmrA family NAD(P)-binding protein [Gammaproteobacteria bacterium]